MIHEDTHDNELPFRPDFASRVMAQADAITTRRRQTRVILAGMSVAIVAAVAMLGLWKMWPSNAPEKQPIPREIASYDSGEIAVSQGARKTLVDFMFPDAAALSRFSQEYEGSNIADAVENDAVFFPNADLSDVEVDGS